MPSDRQKSYLKFHYEEILPDSIEYMLEKEENMILSKCDLYHIISDSYTWKLVKIQIEIDEPGNDSFNFKEPITHTITIYSPNLKSH